MNNSGRSKMSSDIVAEAIFRQHTPITEKPINVYPGIFTKESFMCRKKRKKLFPFVYIMPIVHLVLIKWLLRSFSGSPTKQQHSVENYSKNVSWTSKKNHSKVVKTPCMYKMQIVVPIHCQHLNSHRLFILRLFSSNNDDDVQKK